MHVLTHDKKYGAVDAQGRVVIPFAFPFLYQGEDADRVAFRREAGGLIGYYDAQGEVVVPERFGSAFGFCEGVAGVQLAGFKGGTLVGLNGEPLFERVFQSVQYFGGDHAVAKEGGRWGVIDLDGVWVLEPQLDEVRGVDGGAVVAKRAKKWGVLGVDGVDRSAFKYVELTRPRSGSICFRRGKKWGLLGYDGQELMKPTFGTPRLAGGHIAAAQDGRWGLMTAQGETVIPFEFDSLQPPSEGLCIFGRDGKLGALDLKGKVRFEGEWSSLSPFRDGTTVANGTHIVDASGQTVAEIDFSQQPSLPYVDPLAFDDANFGPYLRAGLAMMGGTDRGRSQSILKSVGSRWPAVARALLLAMSHERYTSLGAVELLPDRWRVLSRRLRFARAAGSEYWLEIDRTGLSAKVVEVTDEGERVPWHSLDYFFEQLWEHGLDREPPPDRQSEDAKRFAEALATARQ